MQGRIKMPDNLVTTIIPRLMRQYNTPWSIGDDALFLLQCVSSDNLGRAKYFLTQINPRHGQEVTDYYVLNQLPTGAVTREVNQAFATWWDSVKYREIKHPQYGTVKLEDRVFLP